MYHSKSLIAIKLEAYFHILFMAKIQVWAYVEQIFITVLSTTSSFCTLHCFYRWEAQVLIHGEETEMKIGEASLVDLHLDVFLHLSVAEDLVVQVDPLLVVWVLEVRCLLEDHLLQGLLVSHH